MCCPTVVATSRRHTPIQTASDKGIDQPTLGLALAFGFLGHLAPVASNPVPHGDSTDRLVLLLGLVLAERLETESLLCMPSPRWCPSATDPLVKRLTTLGVSLLASVGLTGCPLSDHYYIEKTPSASGSSGGQASGGQLVDSGGSSHSAGASNGGASEQGGAVDIGGAGGSGGTNEFGAGGACVLGPFEAPQLITGLGLTGTLWGPALSGDGLTLYFGAVENSGGEHIYRAKRTNRGTVFAAAERIAALASNASDGTPCVSPDELTIYFYSTRAGAGSNRDLWAATRSSVTATFGTPTSLATLNTSSNDYQPWISSDERTLLYVAAGTAGLTTTDVWIVTRTDNTQTFSEPARLSSINSSSNEQRASMSSDALTVYFSSDRPGGLGGSDIWRATRTDPSSEFSAASVVSGVNTSANDMDPLLSRDDTELFFSSSRNGTSQLWRSSRTCQ